MEKFGLPVKRLFEHPVRLTNGEEVLHGVKFWEYPVDVPPLVEVPSVGLVLYREVWERRGWTVEEKD